MLLKRREVILRMIKLFFKSFKDCLDDFKKYGTFELLCVIFTSFIWVPVLTYIYKFTLGWMGTSSLINNEIYSIFKSYKGVIGVTLILTICALIILVEVGVLIVLSQKNYFEKNVSLAGSLIFVLKRLPKFVRLGFFQLVPFLLLAILTLNLPILNIITEKFNVPIFFTSKLEGQIVFLVVFGVCCMLIAYMFLRIIFAMHFLIIKGQNVSAAILSSIRLTKHNKIRILFYLIIFNGIIISLGASIIYSITYLIKTASGVIHNPLFTNYFTTLSSYLTYLLIIMIMPVNIIFLTNLFYHFLCSGDKKSDDNLDIKRYPRLEYIESCVVDFYYKKRYLLSFIIALYLTFAFVLNYSFVEHIFNWDVLVAAHRGYHLAPENSLSGIREAIIKGADAVEIDVQMTRDGVLVLNHDKTLKRVAGVNQKVSQLTYDELKKLSIGAGTEYPDEKIPTLEEALNEIRNNNSRVILDLKPNGFMRDMVIKTVDLIESCEMVENTYVQSFDQNILIEFRKQNPDIKLGQILIAATGNLSDLDVDFYTIQQYILSDTFIKNSHSKNRSVWVWTVNLDKNIREVLKYRVDGIITDYPEKVKEIIAQ